MATSDRQDPAEPSRYSDKRDSVRLRVPGDLVGEITVFQPMAVKESSRGGVQVETSFPLQLESLHDLRFTLGDRSIVVKGRVAHCRICGMDQERVTYRSGFEFTDP